MVAVCRWGGEVVIGGAQAGGAEGGVVGWCGGLFPLLRMARICRLILLNWGSSKVCGSSACDVGVGVVPGPSRWAGSRCAEGAVTKGQKAGISTHGYR